MLIFDIETGPLPDEILKAQFVFEDPPPPGEFIETAVKIGNLKDPTKIKEKIESAKAAHEKAVAEHSDNVAAMRTEAWRELLDGAALSHFTGQMLAIGYKSTESGKWAIHGEDAAKGEDEVKLLAGFWDVYNNNRHKKRRMCGFNISGFDLPFLIHRSWIHSLDVPTGVYPPPAHRYLDSAMFVDLAERWQCGQRNVFTKLDVICKALGIGGKPDGVSGKDFAKLWVSDRAKAEEYLLNDLNMTEALATRMGILA